MTETEILGKLYVENIIGGYEWQNDLNFMAYMINPPHYENFYRFFKTKEEAINWVKNHKSEDEFNADDKFIILQVVSGVI